jgi:hypothetical protein
VTSTPKVSITLLNAVSDEEKAAMESGLHMLYVQAQKGQQRYQWVVFPPAQAALGITEDAPDECVLLERFQASKGNKAKWFHKRLPTAQTTALLDVLREKAKEGFTPGYPLAVKLQLDDYRQVWNDKTTPHKALRHIDYALRPYKITLK